METLKYSYGLISWFAFQNEEAIGGKREYFQRNYEEDKMITSIDGEYDDRKL